MVDTSKELLKNRNQNFTVVRYFTWTLEFVSNIFASNLLQAPSNFFFLTVLVAMKYLTQFKHKIRATKLQNKAKIYLAWYLLFQSLHWGSNLVSKYFSIWSGAFYRKIKRIPAKIWLFLTIGAFNKDIKSKRKFFRHLWI